MSGLPPSSRNCFGNGRPMRLPTPPASTIIPIFMRSSGCGWPAPDERREARVAFCHSLRGTADRSRRYHRRRRTAGTPPATTKECGWPLAPGTRRSSSCRSAGNASSSILEARVGPRRDGRSQPDSAWRWSAHGGGDATMPPTRATVDGDHLTVRFNVMVGPGLAPLAAGRWTLREPGRRSDDPAVRRSRDEPAAVFPLTTGLYTVDAARSHRSASRAAAPRVRRHVRRGRCAAMRPGAGRADPAAASTQGPGARCFRLLVSASKLLAAPRPAGASCSPRGSSRSMSGNLRVVHDRMVERGLDRDYDLLDRCSSPASPSAGRSATGCRLARALGRRRRHPARRLVPAAQLGRARRRTSGSSSCGTRRARSRPSATAVPASPATSIRSRRIHKNYTAAIVSSEFDVPFYAEAFGIPEERVVPTGIPRDGPLLRRGRAGGRRRGGPRARSPRSSAG